MPKATFTKDFVWKPKTNVRIMFKAGKTYPITTACHADAVKAGALPPASGGYVERKKFMPLIGAGNEGQ